MTDNGVTVALLGRALLSLVVVLALILVAYVMVKRHRNRGARSFAAAPARRAAGTPRPARQQLTVLSRVTTSRTSAVSAVQFGDRVILIGTNDQAATQVLAEMSLAAWEPPAEVDPEVELLTAGRTPVGNFVEALRTATARHA